jgi:ABC-type nitrate/sulfonate/bicarbonate transport system substrate-binding protein
MSIATEVRKPTTPALEQIWFTRCPVPTATGLAYKLGWLGEEFATDGIRVDTLQDNRQLGRHHYDHQLDSLIREGGNILALAARAQGAPTRLIGLTWIDEWQTILVRPDSGISEPAHLKGKRLALPDWSEHAIPSHARGSSIARGMSLQGYRGALEYAGLGFHDVELVEVPSNRSLLSTSNDQNGVGGLWQGLHYLNEGLVDAVYVKGASAVDAARAAGAVVGIDLDALPGQQYRVNNGTPRPITVHEDLIENHFDELVRFLDQTLRAADWAADNLDGVQQILASETRGSAEAVSAAYRNDFHRKLHPDLSAERLRLFEIQKKNLWLFGFLERDFDFADWVDPRPLQAAHALRAERRKQGR